METLMDQIVVGCSVFIYALIAGLCDRLSRAGVSKKL